ncbi:MAG: fibronectin type III domain-containing protein [Bacteroidota bacterium]|nr:fibronectin type III domain-containing protein [Bacteroidota bacterium]
MLLTIPLNYVYENEPATHANQHSCIITGLKSGEKYIYRVGNTNTASGQLFDGLPFSERRMAGKALTVNTNKESYL